MAKNDSLSIVPAYVGKNKVFDGFYVYNNGKRVMQDGKPVVLRMQEDDKYYQLDEKENMGPKKGAPNGIYALASLEADNDVYAYSIKYGSRVWQLSYGDFERIAQPALVFKTKSENGSFKGYTITQFNEETKKMETRGTVSANDVIYKRRPDGKYACIYNDETSDHKVVPYYMETISKEEYQQRSSEQKQQSALQAFGTNITYPLNDSKEMQIKPSKSSER